MRQSAITYVQALWGKETHMHKMLNGEWTDHSLLSRLFTHLSSCIPPAVHVILFRIHITITSSHTHTPICTQKSLHISTIVTTFTHRHIHNVTHANTHTVLHTFIFIFYAERLWWVCVWGGGGDRRAEEVHRKYISYHSMSFTPFHFQSLADASEPGLAVSPSPPNPSLLAVCLLAQRH